MAHNHRCYNPWVVEKLKREHTTHVAFPGLFESLSHYRPLSVIKKKKKAGSCFTSIQRNPQKSGPPEQLFGHKSNLLGRTPIL